MKIELELGDVTDEVADALRKAIDPKGNIVLRQFGNDALLYRPANTYTPFVVASGYDREVGEWSQGNYFSALDHAYNTANPEIIERTCSTWQREDIRRALEDAGIKATEENVESVASSPIVNRALRDNAIASGWETIGCAIDDCLWKGEISRDDSHELGADERERETERSVTEHEDR